MESAFGRVEAVGSSANPTIGYIKVLGKWDEKLGVTPLEHNEVIREFPNRGQVFAPNFKRDFPKIQAGDYITFSCIENPRGFDPANRFKDKYVIPAVEEGGNVKKVSVFPVSSCDVPDAELRAPGDGAYKPFFIREKGGIKYLCGPLSSDGRPKSGKEIKAWKLHLEDIIHVPDTNEVLFLGDITKLPVAFEIDCMTDGQLFEWFKRLPGISGNITSETLSRIKTAFSSEELGGDRQLIVDRLARVKNNLGNLVYTWDELKKLQDNDLFREVVVSAINQNLDEVVAQNIEKIERRVSLQQRELEEKIAQLNADIADLEKACSDKRTAELKLKEKCTTLKKKNDELISEAQKLDEKKAELIADIRLKAGIGLFERQSSSNWSYPLERIERQESAAMVGSAEIGGLLSERLDPEWEPTMEIFSSERIINTTDIRTGVLIANALGNTVYLLCQPSPRWMSFNEFWSEALKPIWESAHANRDVWHLLLIENFNIALPECWGKPLWNILSGLTTQLPCAKVPEYPGNLRIIVSSAPIESEDDSHLGLPTRVGGNWNTVSLETVNLFGPTLTELHKFAAEHYCQGCD